MNLIRKTLYGNLSNIINFGITFIKYLLGNRKEEIKINKVNFINVLGILLILSALLYPAGYIKSITVFILLYVIGMALIVTGRIMVKKKS